MRIFYSLLIALATPLVLLYFTVRGLRDRAWLKRWRERFGLIPVDVRKRGIWVHAASVGEFNAASPLIRAMLKKYPEIPLTVTTFTPTGSGRVTLELGDRVAHFYIPIDLPGAVGRFLKRLQPRLIVVMETEIWPNLYLRAQRSQIPLLIANARLSQRSVQRFQRLPGFAGRVIQSAAWVGAQSSGDAERFASCGARHPPEITGNLKFDLDVAASLEEKAEALRSRWGRDRPVIVAGSTHEADENVVIPAFVELLGSFPDALLILVPRYPERFARATFLAKTAGLATELRSNGEACTRQAQCFVIDTLGELMIYYACADVAFVGGSFGDQGGHNPLEPAALGKPVLLGPNMENASEIAAQLIECNAAMRVGDRAGFLRAAKQVLSDGVLRDRMGQAGLGLVRQNRGALELTLKAIDSFL